jgi:DNA-binding protein Fis
VKGKIPEPPSNAPAATKTKYNKAEVKAKKIIRDSIDKHLVAYISELNTSKEIYDRLVSMFKVSDANQIFISQK